MEHLDDRAYGDRSIYSTTLLLAYIVALNIFANLFCVQTWKLGTDFNGLEE